MSVLFASQAVVLLVGGYLVGVGYFRARWVVKVPPPKPCVPNAWGSVSCEGPASTLEVTRWGNPRRWAFLHCENCRDWARVAHAAQREQASAYLWPFVLVKKTVATVIGIGESLAGVESRALPRETPEAVEVDVP